MVPNPEEEHWRSIAEQASKETDQEKLLFLVRQLCSAFDDRRNVPESTQRFGTDPDSAL